MFKTSRWETRNESRSQHPTFMHWCTQWNSNYESPILRVTLSHCATFYQLTLFKFLIQGYWYSTRLINSNKRKNWNRQFIWFPNLNQWFMTQQKYYNIKTYLKMSVIHYPHKKLSEKQNTSLMIKINVEKDPQMCSVLQYLFPISNFIN